MNSVIKADIAKRNGRQRAFRIQDFEIGKLLGSGQFGVVYLARDKKSKYVIALKTLKKSELLKSRCTHQVLREIEIQCHLHHPNILALYNYFWDDVRIYLILEFVPGGEMFTVLQNQPHRRFSPDKAAKYVYQVADGLEYCHSKNVMHRDIKPENLLIDINGNIKLADFGWSVHAPSDRRRTKCGTREYLPPEMVEGKAYNKKVDHWCLGILTFEFCCGRTPFESDNDTQVERNIIQCQVVYPSHMDAGVINLIGSLLK
ncbi:unnamed protein product [Nesidiocoris tenuis]|nr:unnamed protein product [Nesidiocoris tenuis]CAB0003282.1 unnamed protein product [Nesidiocoris tenuis]